MDSVIYSYRDESVSSYFFRGWVCDVMRIGLLWFVVLFLSSFDGNFCYFGKMSMVCLVLGLKVIIGSWFDFSLSFRYTVLLLLIGYFLLLVRKFED